MGHPWVERVHPFGNLHGTVQVFDDATLVRFAVDERHGVSVSVDPGTGVDFERFVREWQGRFGGATVEF